MDRIDYKKIYTLQDEILDLMFAEDTEFYLTGGTCLNRFYFEKRYSDDLDFFTNFSDTFPYSVREIINRISVSHFFVQKQVDSKDFIRMNVDKNGVLLQVDFVNDRVISNFLNFCTYCIFLFCQIHPWTLKFSDPLMLRNMAPVYAQE